MQKNLSVFFIVCLFFHLKHFRYSSSSFVSWNWDRITNKLAINWQNFAQVRLQLKFAFRMRPLDILSFEKVWLLVVIMFLKYCMKTCRLQYGSQIRFKNYRKKAIFVRLMNQNLESFEAPHSQSINKGINRSNSFQLSWKSLRDANCYQNY